MTALGPNNCLFTRDVMQSKATLCISLCYKNICIQIIPQVGMAYTSSFKKLPNLLHFLNCILLPFIVLIHAVYL